jgi:hypothetical protein
MKAPPSGVLQSIRFWADVPVAHDIERLGRLVSQNAVAKGVQRSVATGVQRAVAGRRVLFPGAAIGVGSVRAAQAVRMSRRARANLQLSQALPAIAMRTGGLGNLGAKATTLVISSLLPVILKLHRAHTRRCLAGPASTTQPASTSSSWLQSTGPDIGEIVPPPWVHALLSSASILGLLLIVALARSCSRSCSSRHKMDRGLAADGASFKAHGWKETPSTTVALADDKRSVANGKLPSTDERPSVAVHAASVAIEKRPSVAQLITACEANSPTGASGGHTPWWLGRRASSTGASTTGIQRTTGSSSSSSESIGETELAQEQGGASPTPSTPSRATDDATAAWLASCIAEKLVAGGVTLTPKGKARRTIHLPVVRRSECTSPATPTTSSPTKAASPDAATAATSLAAATAKRRSSRDTREAAHRSAAEIASVLVAGGVQLAPRGQPRRTYPQYMPTLAAPSDESESGAASPSYKLFRASRSASDSSASAWRIASNAGSQLSWLVEAEGDASGEEDEQGSEDESEREGATTGDLEI